MTVIAVTSRPPAFGLRLTPAAPSKAAKAVVLTIIAVTAVVLALDCGIFRSHLPADTLRFYESPLWPRTAWMCAKAAIEETERLLIMSALAWLAAVFWHKTPAWVFWLIIVAAQFAIVGHWIVADLLYASLRYVAVGCAWGWLYWRHGWVSALIGHALTHLLLDPLLLVGLR